MGGSVEAMAIRLRAPSPSRPRDSFLQSMLRARTDAPESSYVTGRFRRLCSHVVTVPSTYVTMRRLAFVFMMTATTACVSTPYNDTEVAATQQPVNFRGYWISPAATLQIVASSSPNGPFTPIGSAVTQTNGYQYPDGLTVYFFETLVTVPESQWSGDSCSGQQTYLRAVNADGWTVPSLDEIAPNGEAAYTCIQNRVNDGWSTINAIYFCASPDSPNVRLYTAASTGPSAHTGNVNIATAADEKYWSCLETLQGNLTVPGLGPDNVGLPRLQQVSGDVSVVYDRFSLPTGDEGSHLFEVPVLTTIGGSFIASSPPISPATVLDTGRVVLGLNALTSLQGNLQIHVDAGNMFVSGMASLSAVGGDLTIDGGTGDASMSQFAPSVTQIGNDLEVTAGNNIQELLVGLQVVQGSVRQLDGNLYATGAVTDTYRSLQSVGGDLVLESAVIFGSQPLMPSLTNVGGGLEYRQMSGPSSVRVGATNVSVGSLLVDDNAALTQLGASSVVLDPAGALQVTNNPNLCVSTVGAFTAAQSGWTGPLTQSGNDDGC